MTCQIDSVSATHLFNCYRLTGNPEVIGSSVGIDAVTNGAQC